MRTFNKLLQYKAIVSVLSGTIAILGICSFPSPSLSKSLKVATKTFVPFSFVQDGHYIGFSIDLWEKIAEELNLEYELYGEQTVDDLLTSVSSGSTDIAIAGITITAAREETVDFSYSFYESGLQILVPANAKVSPVNSFIWLIFSPILLRTIGVLLLIIIIVAHICWFFERQNNPQMFPRSYLKGIWEAYWWAVVTLVTVGYGDKAPIGIPGRIIATIWMFTGVLLISYFTASVSSALTVQQLESNIQTPENLNGKRVATLEGSTAAAYLANRPIKKIEFDTIEEAFKSLDAQEVDAIVYDAPVLQNYAAKEGVGKAKVVGSVFAKQSYGIVLKTNSPYREQVNQALLKLVENGVYEEVYQKWFGDSEAS